VLNELTGDDMKSSTFLAIFCCAIPALVLCSYADSYSTREANERADNAQRLLGQTVKYDMPILAADQAFQRVGFKFVSSDGPKRVYEMSLADTAFSHLTNRTVVLTAAFQNRKLQVYKVTVTNDGFTFLR
jgi:hypothetical protein